MRTAGGEVPEDTKLVVSWGVCEDRRLLDERDISQETGNRILAAEGVSNSPHRRTIISGRGPSGRNLVLYEV